MKALVTGATGAIGRRLVTQLEQAVVLSRSAERAAQRFPDAECHSWEPLDGLPPAAAFDGVDVVFHLAGEPVGEGKWTPEKKQAILDSRVTGTEHLVAALRALDTRPKVLVTASAVGFYGDRGDETLDEQSSSGGGFLAEVCVGWEGAAMAARELGLRVVCARIGLVLMPEAGLVPRLRTPFRLGAGGRLGSGRQYMPWVHADDVVRLLLHAARLPGISGPLNIVAPEPVTNREFTKAMGRAVRRPTLFPVPEVALRAAFGELADAMLASQRAVPTKALRSGYQFAFSSLDDALSAAVAAA